MYILDSNSPDNARICHKHEVVIDFLVKEDVWFIGKLSTTVPL